MYKKLKNFFLCLLREKEDEILRPIIFVGPAPWAYAVCWFQPPKKLKPKTKMANEETKKEKGWLGNFVEKNIWGTKEDTSAETPNTQTTTQPNTTIASPQVTEKFQMKPVLTSPVSQDIDEKYVENFLSVMRDANFPGPDYYELFVSVREMQNDPEFSGMPATQIIKICYKTLKTQGLTLDFLNSSSQQYIGLLGQHYEEFITKELPTRVDSTVGTLEGENANLQLANNSVSGQIEKIRTDKDNAVKGYEQQIAQLNQRISETKLAAEGAEQKLKDESAERTKKIGENKKKIEEENSKLQKVKNKLDAAYQLVLGWIKSDQEIIKQIN